MKLVRFGPPSKEKPGLIDAEGRLRDLSTVVKDIGPEQLSEAALAKLARLKTDKLPLVRGKPRLGCPVSGTPKFIAIGLNYADHAAESGLPIPAEPVVFMKATSCIQGPNDPVMLPKGSKKTDWEVELGVIIGTRARYVSQKEALNHVAGYCAINDVSEREYQTERGGTWDKGKGCDTFGPVGPWLLTRDEVPNPQKLTMWLDLNGKRMQTGTTKTMIFSVAKIVSYVSQFMTLEPGDIITTGTPPGVGLGMKPPLYLKKGDVMTLGIEGLGECGEVPVLAQGMGKGQTGKPNAGAGLRVELGDWGAGGLWHEMGGLGGGNGLNGRFVGCRGVGLGRDWLKPCSAF